ncbi:MAG: hypothetical protein QXF61_07940 [Nitrososphaeria archaeon]
MRKLSYERIDIKRRYKIYIRRLERYKNDLDTLINILLNTNQEEKAWNWMILRTGLETVIDMWSKMVGEL